MAYRYGNREQLELFPSSIEDYVSKDDPVRAYDTFVEALDFDGLGIVLDDNKIGNPEYDPKSMLKLLIYGYSYGIRSSRKLERAVYHNISFIWLTGGIKPDHKTISSFRKNNRPALKEALKQCARLCLRLGLIEGNTLFLDGTKIRANASIKNTWTKERCEKYLKHIDKHIGHILSECDHADQEERNQRSLVKLKEELADKEALKSAVRELMDDLKDKRIKSINTIDPECTRINSIQGSHAGYSAQIVVDEKQGLIVASDVVSENSDSNQFAVQVGHANDVLDDKCKIACADAGYADTEELKKVDAQDIKVIVPSQRQASQKDFGPFDKERFKYDAEKDSYTCPEGNKLTYNRSNNHHKVKIYTIPENGACKQCCRFGVCTKSENGREINRLFDEETRLKMEAQYKEPESQAIYKLRMQKAELPFGHIKRNLGVSAFLLRGVEGAKSEMSILASNFNIARMISILGVETLIDKLKPNTEYSLPILVKAMAV
jgi:transposase